MADDGKSPFPGFVADAREPVVEVFRPETAEGQGIPAHNPNHDKPTLGLPPGSDRMSPAEAREVFEEMRGDYRAARAERETPRADGPAKHPIIDMGNGAITP